MQCQRCHVSPPFSCSCSVSLLCSSCFFALSASWPESHSCPERATVICSFCEVRQAEWACVCSVPLRLYCDDCYSSHLTANSVHMKVPAGVKASVSSAGELENFLRKQMFVDRVVATLRGNVKRLEAFQKQVDNTFLRLAAELNQHRESCCQKLSATAAELKDTLDCLEARIQMVRYWDSACTCDLDEIVKFGWQHSPPLDSLDMIAMEFAANLPPPVMSVDFKNPFQPATLMPVAKNDNVFLIEISSGAQHAVSLPAHKIDSGTSFCFLSSSSVFCCGGMSSLKPSATVYELQLSPCALRSLPPMDRGRGFAGLVYHRFHVYVFGGGDGKAMRHCEKFNRIRETWQPMPRMLHSRCAFNPSVYQEQAILVGNHPRGVVERFWFESEEFEELRAKCPVNDTVLTVVWGDDLLVLASSGILSLRLNTDSVFLSTEFSGLGQSWSNIQPISWGSCFFYLQGNGQVPMALLCFQMPSFGTQILASF